MTSPLRPWELSIRCLVEYVALANLLDSRLAPASGFCP
jgi:hypothetical protein